jgi:hypothetical protein
LTPGGHLQLSHKFGVLRTSTLITLQLNTHKLSIIISAALEHHSSFEVDIDCFEFLQPRQ